jgi:hypothetical protein
MLEPIAQVWLLIGFAIAGVLVGVAQTFADRTCQCCRLLVSRMAPTCPYCRCRRPGRWG